MVKAAEPDRIPIHSPAQLHQEVAALLVALNKPEDEHTWESIDKAIKRFHAVVRGGGAKSFPDEFVKVMKDKPIVNGLVRSLITERTRLSGSTLDLIAACTRLGAHFQPLLHLYFPVILRLLCRTNKLYIARAATTIASIICHTHLPDVLKYIVIEWKIEPGKSSSFREKAAEALSVALGVGGDELMIEKEGFERRMEELEWMIRTGATDREAKVRTEIKKCWEVYKTTWPERVPQFTAPMTPIIRRYLNVGGAAPSAAASAPSRAPIKKPKVPSGLSSSVSGPPSKAPSSSLSTSTSHKPTASTSLSASTSARPTVSRNALSASTSRAPTTLNVPPKEPLRNLSRSVGPSVGVGHASHNAPVDPTRTASGSASSSRSASRNQEREESADRSNPPSAAPTPAANSTYRSGMTNKAPIEAMSTTLSRSQSATKPSDSAAPLAPTTSRSRHAPPLPTHHDPFKPSASSTTRPLLPPSSSSSSLGGELRKARRVIAAAPPVPSLPSTTAAPTIALSRSTSGNAPSLSASVGRNHGKAMPAPAPSGPFRPQPPAGSARAKAANPTGTAVPGRVVGAAPSASRGAAKPATIPVTSNRERARSPDLAKKAPIPSVTPSAATLAARERRENKEAAAVEVAAPAAAVESSKEEASEAELERLVEAVDAGGQPTPSEAEQSVEENVLAGLDAEEAEAESQEMVVGEVGMDSTIFIEESQAQTAVAPTDPEPIEEPHQPIVEEEPVNSPTHDPVDFVSLVEPSSATEDVSEDEVLLGSEMDSIRQDDAPVVDVGEAPRPAAPHEACPASPVKVDDPVVEAEDFAEAEEQAPIIEAEVEQEQEEVLQPSECLGEAEQLGSEEMEEEQREVQVLEQELVVEDEDAEGLEELEEAQEVQEVLASGLVEEEEVDAPSKRDMPRQVAPVELLVDIEADDGDAEADDDIQPRELTAPSTPTRLSPTSPNTSFTPRPSSPMFSNLPSTSTFAPAFSSPEPFAQTCSIVMETPPRWDPKVKGGIRLPGMRSISVKLTQEQEPGLLEGEPVAIDEEPERSESPSPSSPIAPSVDPPTRGSRSPSPSPLASPLDQQRMQDVSAIFLPDDSLIGGDLEDSSFEREDDSFAEVSAREFDVPLNDASMLFSASDTPEAPSSRKSRLDPTVLDGRFVDESAPTVVISPTTRQQPFFRVSKEQSVVEEDEPESSFELELEDHARELVFHDETEDEVESAAEEDTTTDQSSSTIGARSPSPVKRDPTPEPADEEPVVLKRSLRNRVVTVEVERKTPAPATRALTRSRGAGGAVLGEMQL